MTAQPLGESELDRLAEILDGLGDAAMNLETLDGFLAALACGPTMVTPGEFLPQLWGEATADRPAIAAQPVLHELLTLVTAHWNGICSTLQSGDVHMPLLFQENGIAHANDWAKGFMRGMAMRRSDWFGLLEDEQRGGSLAAIFALAHEHDPDPEMRPYAEPVSAQRREDLIVAAAAGVAQIYRYFEAERLLDAQPLSVPTVFQRGARKVGRNQPCPCGSGRKFKRCCARLDFH